MGSISMCGTEATKNDSCVATQMPQNLMRKPEHKWLDSMEGGIFFFSEFQLSKFILMNSPIFSNLYVLITSDSRFIVGN